MTETLGGGFHIEHATGGGLILLYRDKTSTSSCVQDELYADDLMLTAEARQELQHMITALDQACEQWGMHINGEKTKILTVGVTDNQPPLKLKDQQLEEVESRGSGPNYQSRKRGDGETEEGWYSVPDVEMEGILKPQSQQDHQAPCSPHVGDANPSVWCGDMACHTTGHQEPEDLPHEVPLGILGLTLWDIRRNANILRETGELPIEEQLRRKHLQWFGHVKRMYDDRPQKQLLKCRPRGKKRPQGGTPPEMDDLIHQQKPIQADQLAGGGEGPGHMASLHLPALTCQHVIVPCIESRPTSTMDKE